MLGAVDQYKVVSLFPYQIKNSANFIQRDHIPYRPEVPSSVHYARETWRKIVEGMWVYDEGTWVYMLPKLFFYINLGTISYENYDGTREFKYPDMRDNEWIILTHVLCCDGFSGFEGDQDYTCNVTIEKIENQEPVSPAELQRAEAHCRRPNGTWKKYMNAWDYLTVFYLLERPLDKPLGLPLYENSKYNGLLIGSRKLGKTFSLSGADMVHQYITNGALRFEQLKKNTTTNIFVGSSDSNFVNSFLTTAETCWRNLPGGSDGRPSPFFRDAVGPWNSSDRKPIVQGYNVGGSEIKGSKSEIAKAVLQPHSAFSGVSKRLSRFYLDEIGLQTNSRSILEATDASLKADKGKSGVFYGTGTGGNIDAIVQTKDLMIHPHKYDMYSIPNYWADMSDMCLFIPVSYTLADYKDKHGNTDLLASTEYVVKERFEKSGGDSSKIVAKRQNEPLEPKEVYLSGKSDFFGSSKEIMMDRIEIMEAGLFDKKAQTYDLTLSRRPDGEYTVHPEIVDRMSNALLGPDILGKTGELIVVEPPTPHEGHLYTDNLYKIVYDLVQDITVTNTGTAKQKKERKLSYAYIAVYKGVPKRSLESEELYSTLVAFALFRRDDMSNHEMALKLAIWYQAKVLYEKNVSGVSGYFGKYNLTSYLQPTPYRTIKEVSPGTTQTKYDTGVYMTKELKSRGLREYQKWLTDICYIDNNNRAYRNAENLWDLALLYQTLQFNFDDNFDAVSGMVLLMLWLYEEHSPEEATEEAQYTESDYSELEAFVASYY